VGVINLVKEEGREGNGEGDRIMEEGEGGRGIDERERERERGEGRREIKRIGEGMGVHFHPLDGGQRFCTIILGVTDSM
jgi:hypothetical protein